MPATVDDLHKTLQDILAATRGSGGSSAPTNPLPKATHDTASGFGELSKKMLQAAAGFATIGTVLRGLEGTREGYLLNYSMQKIFFEIADMLRDPIRIITRELSGLGNVLHAMNSAPSNSGLNKVLALGSPAADVMTRLYHRLTGTEAAAAASPHLAPMYHTSYGGVEGLQQKYQQLSTENPAQEKGISLVESIYNLLAKIYNKLPGFGEEIPLIKVD